MASNDEAPTSPYDGQEKDIVPSPERSPINDESKSPNAKTSTDSTDKSPPPRVRKSPRHNLMQPGGSKNTSDDDDDDDDDENAPSPERKPFISVYEYGSGKRLEPKPPANAPIPSPPKLGGSPPAPARTTAKTPKAQDLSNDKILSLPFLVGSQIANVLIEQEHRALSRSPKPQFLLQGIKPADHTSPGDSHQYKINPGGHKNIWQADEVINFFRGLFNYGWGDWRRVSRMIQTRSNSQCKTHAQKLLQRFPILKHYFSIDRIMKMRQKYGKVGRYPNGSDDDSSYDSSASKEVSIKSTVSSKSAASKSSSSFKRSSKRLTKKKTSSASKPSNPEYPEPTVKESLLSISKTDSKEEASTRSGISFQGSARSLRSEEEASISTTKSNDAAATHIDKGKQENGNAGSDDRALMAASVMNSLKQNSEPIGIPPRRILGKANLANVPKVTICLGNGYAVDTNPSMSDARARKRSAEALEPPKAPNTTNRNIFIPGARVYARWLDEDDPDSYGTWYPGYLISSTIAPEEERNGSSDIPQLHYHVKFDDGVVVTNQKAADIMMYDEYRAWQMSLEEYYALPVTSRMVSKRLMKGSRVFAKFFDETDPEMHGQWLAGTVVKSKVANSISQLRYSYHVLFVNGDQDEDLKDIHVLEEELYHRLMADKNQQRNKRARASSGLDFLCGAANISSPIKTKPSTDASSEGGRVLEQIGVEKSPSIESTEGQPPVTDIMAPSNGSGRNVIEGAGEAFFIKPEPDTDMVCHEVLESRTPSPVGEPRDPVAPKGPALHYGCYYTTKTKKVVQFVPQPSHKQQNKHISSSAIRASVAAPAKPAIVSSSKTSRDNPTKVSAVIASNPNAVEKKSSGGIDAQDPKQTKNEAGSDISETTARKNAEKADAKGEKSAIVDLEEVPSKPSSELPLKDNAAIADRNQGQSEGGTLPSEKKISSKAKDPGDEKFFSDVMTVPDSVPGSNLTPSTNAPGEKS